MGLWSTVGSIAGGVLGTVVAPGIGTALGASLGGAVGGLADGSSAGGAIRTGFGTQGTTGSLNPGWVNTAAQNLYTQGQTAAATPYNYTGPLVAPVGGNQRLAINSAASQPGAYDSTYNTAENLYNQSATPYTATYNPSTISTQNFNTSDISGYMDPYTQGVLNPTLTQLKQVNADQNNQLGLGAGGAGAFGGSREALLESQNNKNYDTAVQNATNQAYSQAFQNAGTLFNQDQSRDLTASTANQQAQANAFTTNYNTAANNQKMQQSAAAGLTGLTGQEASNNNEAVQNLINTGTNIQQATQQRADTAALNQYNTQLQYPMTQVNFLQALLNGNADARTINPSAVSSGSNGISSLLSQLGGNSSIMGLLGQNGSSTSGSSTDWEDEIPTY